MFNLSRIKNPSTQVHQPLRRPLLHFLLLTLLLVPATAEKPSLQDDPSQPLPQDAGASGLRQMLIRLQTTARMVQVTAHPDDEDGGMLTLESRGKGVSTTLLTLNRGEGGQNKVGSNLFDVLGVLRALELTASDRYYGVEQRFTRVADFGFSKSPEETFQKWQGHDTALQDMVRVIRTFRPDVLIARFSGTPRDGHGHHEASGILTKEAFRAAADPKRFPEQLKEGLLPWQASKLYAGNVCGFMSSTCPDENYTLKLNTGKVDPNLGMSYIQFALEGLRHQLSQGAGGWSVEPGDRFTFYKLVDSVLPGSHNGHETNFFDGIDTSLPGLAARLGAEESKVSFLRSELTATAGLIKEASEKSSNDSSAAAPPLWSAVQKLDLLLPRIEKTSLSPLRKEDLLQILHEKQQQVETALNLALGVTLNATVTQAGSESTYSSAAFSPGQDLAMSVVFQNHSKTALEVTGVSLEGFKGWNGEVRSNKPAVVQPGAEYTAKFPLHVPANATYTRPYWHRDNPEEDAVNMIDDPDYATLPFPPFPFHAIARYRMAGSNGGGNNPGVGLIKAPALVPVKDEQGSEELRRLAVTPVFSVMLEPGEQVLAVENGAARAVDVAVMANLEAAPKGRLHLQAPQGWRVEPTELPVELHHRGEKKDFEFKLLPSNLKEGHAQVRAVLEAAGTKYTEGYSLVTRDDLAAFYYYQAALQRVSIVEVKVPKDVKVGYVMGAGDEIPTVLSQIGMDVTLIPAEKLATEDLSRFGTVILGIRVYDTRKEVAESNKKLLDYVSGGGTLVVQYNASTGDFNSGHFTPYPAELSRARVSVEEAPVDILAPDDSVFNYPNKISERDFEGWVQERGLYFMDQWDDHFKPLLASHDPGEQPQKGGLLRAQYGKGTYIYTGYAFFRQLPAGVPGAIRLYANLLAAGHDGGSASQ